MEIYKLTTPNFLLDLNLLEQNITAMADICQANKKMLCPMVKTHKSMEIAAMQANHGAAGFLVGTLDEAEKLIQAGFTEIMLAYPVAASENIIRVIELAKQAHIILSFDGVCAAAQFQEHLVSEDLVLDYLIIIDSGLHRFGVEPDQVLKLACDLKQFASLRFKGIATHPGHVYGKGNLAEVEIVARQEIDTLTAARELLTLAGFEVNIVATGSTPTAVYVGNSNIITMLRPGNYVFYDAIQSALGVVSPERCALTVLATITSQPSGDIFIIDAGSKCLGLDKGAHSVSLIKGYGLVKNHQELIIESLSEEVGKIRIAGKTSLKVGDRLEIIPNHACAAANMTSHLVGHRNGNVARIISIDARGGTTCPRIRTGR